jgi:PRTRC genetic system protein B
MPDVAGMMHACFGAVLRWSTKDPIGQIVDDYVNDAQNGGECTSDYSWHFIELDTDVRAPHHRRGRPAAPYARLHRSADLAARGEAAMKTHVHASGDISTKLSSALLVYEGHDSAFVTVHAAEVIRRRVTIGPGMPATRSALAELARKLSNATAIAGFIPPQLLYMSPRVISWWRPASPARVFFAPPAHANDDERRIGTRNAVTPQPDLVFAVTARDWFVWAADVYAGAPRPAPNVKLLRAPYFNVWKDGRICTGNVKLPQT